MIIAIRPIDTMYPTGTMLDSVVPVVMCGNASGEVFYPAGGQIKLTDSHRVIQVIEQRGRDIVERYYLQAKETKSTAPKLHQIQVKIVPNKPTSPYLGPEVLTDVVGLSRIYPEVTLDQSVRHVTPNHLSSILLRCVIAELVEMECLDKKALHDVRRGIAGERVISLEEVSRWNMAKRLNWLTHEDAQHAEPTYMAALLSDHQHVPYSRESSEYILGDLEGVFIPAFSSLVPDDTLSGINWMKGGVSLRDLKQRLVEAPLPVDVTSQRPICKLPPLTPELFELINQVHQVRFTDFYLEYISSNCKEEVDSAKIVKLRQLFPAEIVDRVLISSPTLQVSASEFRDRYGLQHPKPTKEVQHNFFKECEPTLEAIGRSLAELFPGIRSATLWKTFNNWVYIEATTDQGTDRYGLDMTWLSVISPNLTYTW